MRSKDLAIELLIVSALQRAATPEELEELERWRRVSDEHEKRYRESVRVWTLMGQAAGGRETRPAPAPAGLIQQAGVLTLPVGTPFRRWHLQARRWLPPTAVAAALVALVVGLISRRHTIPRPDVTFGAAEFITGASDKSTVRLRDGTVVRLAPNTRLLLTDDVGEREVTLEGRAYFAVAKAAGQPFRIHTTAGDVTVLGTRFDLESNRQDLRLIVVEGKVALSASGRETAVEAGEMTRVLDGTPLPVIKLPDIRPAVEWLGDFLAFQATPLRVVALEIGRRYGVQVVVPDPALAERTVTAWFVDRTLPEVLRVVCAASLARCTTVVDVVTMTPM